MMQEDQQALLQRALWLLPGFTLWVLGNQFRLMLWPNGELLFRLALITMLVGQVILLPQIWALKEKGPLLFGALFLLPAGLLFSLWALPVKHLTAFLSLSLALMGGLLFFSKLLPRQIGTRFLFGGYLIMLVGYLYRAKSWPGSDPMIFFGSLLLLLAFLVLLLQSLWNLRKMQGSSEDVLDG